MLTVYTYVPQGWNASFYYRIFVPFWTARDLGLPVQVHVDTNLQGIEPQRSFTALVEADINYLYQPIGEDTLQKIKMAKSTMPSKRDGAWKYPPTLVIETDDNLFNVSPHNQAYRGLGIRDHEGKDIPVGHMIGEVRDGQKKILWEDGKDGFDIARNRQNIQTYRNMIDAADLVSCSTQFVARCVEKDAMPRRTKVFPNLVRFDHYEQVKMQQDPNVVKILWQGGASHYEDWLPLRQAMGNITKKYPQVHWLIWGQMYHWAKELIPADRYTFIDWCPYQEYKLRLATMDHDINLAPLSDNRFNRCRSAIKFYESAVLHKPAATLAQATGPYAEEIKDDETGLLFLNPDEFELQLSRLIEDVKLRKELASNAKDWLTENREAFKKVPEQIAYLEWLRAQTPMEVPHMPESQWETFVKEAEAETVGA